MSSVSYESLNLSKKSLVEALGDNQTKYFQQMKEWFRGKMTKEEFDSNARDLLTPTSVHLHNEFLMAILTKCQLFAPTAPPPQQATSTPASSGYLFSNTSSSSTTTTTTTTTTSTLQPTTSYGVPIATPPHSTTAITTATPTSNGTAAGLFSTTTTRSTNSSSNSSFSFSYTTAANSMISTSTTVPIDIFDTINTGNPYSLSSQNLNSVNYSNSSNLFTNSSSTSNSNALSSSNINSNNDIFSNSSPNLSNPTSNSIFNTGSTTTSTTTNNNINNSNIINNSGVAGTRTTIYSNNNHNINSNSLSNSSNNIHCSSSLGTNTNAITINNSSSNISIKVEVPMHSLEGAGLGGLVGSLTPSSQQDRKKGTRPLKKKHKGNKQYTESGVFEPVSLHSIAPSPSLREPHVLRDSRAGHHTRAHCLLGLGELRGRLLLAAWDHGLTAATEGVVRLLHHAAKQVLQNVLTSVIKSRGGFRVREGRFTHSLGTCPPNPWLRSAAAASDWTADSVGLPVSGTCEGSGVGDRPLFWPTAEAAQQNGAHLMAFAPPHPPPHGPITCLDLYTTLKVWPSVLPCHTVYSLCMERVSSRLSHPDHAALAQEALVKQEQLHRRQLRQYRMLPTT